MKEQLRHLVDDHLQVRKTPFGFDRKEYGAYDAVFPGDRLPSINYDGLKRELSAQVGFKQTADETGFETAAFEGYYRGEPVVLYLRAETVAEQWH